MKISTISFVCMMFLIGCTSSYTVGSKESGAYYDYEQFKKYIEKKKCSVFLISGDEKKVEGIIFTEDSVSMMTPSETKISTPKSQISQIQPYLAGHENEKIIMFTNGQTKIVKRIIFTNDSIFWMEPSFKTESISTSRITKIIYVNRSRGFWEGLWKGTLGGVGTLLAIALPLSGPGDDGLIAGFIGTMVGGGVLIISTGAGVIYGHTEEYQLQTH